MKLKENKGIKLITVGIILVVISILIILAIGVMRKSELITNSIQETDTKEYSETTIYGENDEELLERYIFGADLKGRDYTEIIDFTKHVFIDDEKTIPDASTSITYLTTDSNGYGEDIVYFSYKGIVYKIQNGLVKVYETNNETKVGKIVKYDNKLWTILYDDDVNGLQMISNNALEYDKNVFSIGDEDSLIKNWKSVIKEADLNNDGDLTSFEKNVYSYNNVIKSLNTACKNLVIENSNIVDVRVVGSNPVDKNSENEILYTSDNLKQWPIKNSKYAVGIANGISKGDDTNYLFDFERMVALKINATGDEYWLASRHITDDLDNVYFWVRSCTPNGEGQPEAIWYANEKVVFSFGYGAKLRPVVSLKEDVQFVSGDGTADNPYVF